MLLFIIAFRDWSIGRSRTSFWMCESSTEPMAEDRQLFVDKWLRVCGVADGSIMALGDCARLQGEEQLPETAQVAAQQGAFVARLLNKESLLEIERFWIYNLYLYKLIKKKMRPPQFRKRREKPVRPKTFSSVAGTMACT